ncbi:TPA_asm: alpha-2,3-sialyltransferase [Campylobacter jejuni]|nr:alpha-2,3-sialyltransferase [Campylobacter jejuni]ECL4581790.1 alpha-2,3-sialyltransferase [Campylobacter jejuni]ECO2912170.1 alpha-2,3-sialyltransferase [Campylobacter jejuni]ECR1934994.1 alpha-2,3-sialyltransferase [Campylobacter jejuni]HAA1629693.1 alpha-2,3-sialyltransferase [Campylobacter jejuni]
MAFFLTYPKKHINDNLNFEKLQNINIKIPKKYNFNHLIPQIEIYKEIINEYHFYKDKSTLSQENLLNFQNNYGKAKARIQNQLSYKLGQAMIVNSKSVLGFLSLAFIILSIVVSHKQEQKAYKFKVKKNPNLALPPLETYPDYKEALKEKECFTYKLGEALIQASKNWYGGGYIKFVFKDVPRLKREFRKR